MERQFFYHANAFALGGRITRPCCEILETQAACVLPATGGESRAWTEGFRSRDGSISFRTAHTTVSGSESEEDGQRIFNTLATTTIEGLDVDNVVTADRIVARLASKKTQGCDEPLIRPVGSYFENLRIAGKRIDPEPDNVLLKAGALSELTDGPVDLFRQPVSKCAQLAARPKSQDPFEDRHTLTSLYQTTELPNFDPPKSARRGELMKEELMKQKAAAEPEIPDWAVHVPGFGTVYLGEFLITRYARRLTMMRVELGSPVGGSVVFAVSEGNGIDYP